MKWKKTLSLVLAFSVCGSLLFCSSSMAEETETEPAEESMTEQDTEPEITEDPEDYPSMTIDAVIPWGEGGGTDVLTRPLAELAQESLGGTIEARNMPGDTGTIGTEYVYDQSADGYTLLMSAENPPLYQELGLSDLSYDNFIPVIVIGDETVGIVVGADSEYTNLKDLVNAALTSPGEITMAGTGIGGLPWEVASMLMSSTGAEFDLVNNYDSDDSAKDAVLNGECDFTACKVKAAMDDYEDGQLNFLTMLSTEPVEGLEDVPLVVDDYPDFEYYLPWATFCGIFVKEGTNQGIVDKLTDAFTAAYEDASYQETLEELDVNPLGLTGDDAAEYIKDWQDKTVEAVRISNIEDVEEEQAD